MRPEGATQPSPGQRPGLRVPQQHSRALQISPHPAPSRVGGDLQGAGEIKQTSHPQGAAPPGRRRSTLG